MPYSPLTDPRSRGAETASTHPFATLPTHHRGVSYASARTLLPSLAFVAVAILLHVSGDTLDLDAAADLLMVSPLVLRVRIDAGLADWNERDVILDVLPDWTETVERSSNGGVHVVRQVPVTIHRGLDALMPEPVLDRWKWDAGSDEPRGMSVA